MEKSLRFSAPTRTCASRGEIVSHRLELRPSRVTDGGSRAWPCELEWRAGQPRCHPRPSRRSAFLESDQPEVSAWTDPAAPHTRVGEVVDTFDTRSWPIPPGGRKRTARAQLDAGRFGVCRREEHASGSGRARESDSRCVVIVRTDMCPTLTIGLQPKRVWRSAHSDSERAVDRQLGQSGTTVFPRPATLRPLCLGEVSPEP